MVNIFGSVKTKETLGRMVKNLRIGVAKKIRVGMTKLFLLVKW